MATTKLGIASSKSMQHDHCGAQSINMLSAKSILTARRIEIHTVTRLEIDDSKSMKAALVDRNLMRSE